MEYYFKHSLHIIPHRNGSLSFIVSPTFYNVCLFCLVNNTMLVVEYGSEDENNSQDVSTYLMTMGSFLLLLTIVLAPCCFCCFWICCIWITIKRIKITLQKRKRLNKLSALTTNKAVGISTNLVGKSLCSENNPHIRVAFISGRSLHNISIVICSFKAIVYFQGFL